MASKKKPPFTWNARAGQYVRASGKFVSRVEVQAVIDQTIRRETRNARDLARGLRNGDISLTAWRASMREVISNVHLYNAAAAKGGWAALTQSDYGLLGNIIKKEYTYLERFARRIASGAVPLDGRVTQRAMMYAEAGRTTYYQFERETVRRAGFRFEENVLSGTEHCAGCLTETARGRVLLGLLAPIGTRDCLRHCRCRLRYFRSANGRD